MNWDFHPEALAEYETAAAYYGKHDSDLQLRFVEANRRRNRPNPGFANPLAGD